MSPNEHLLAFQRKLKRTRALLARQISFLHEQRLPKTELEAIYELCFMNIFVAFENELVELLKTNLLMERGGDGKIRSLYRPKSRPSAEKLLLGTNRYFQILPVEQMEKISKVYLRDGEPFVLLNGNQKTELGKASAIRNHIAHRSSESKRTFTRKVLATVNLPRNSTSPGFYLKSSLAQHITYFDHHVAELGGCLRDLVNKS